MSDVSSASSGGNKLRITGMASGLDVDATVKKMIQAEQTKVDKAQQDQQIIKWKQEMYQDIIKDIKALQNTFFDTTSSDKNILSSANYAGFNVTGEDSAIATITAGVGAQTGSYTVDVTSLASKASAVGSNIVNDTMSNVYTDDTKWNGKTIGFSINGGSTQTITLGTNVGIDATITDINNLIKANATLNGKVQAINSGGKIQFQTLSDSSVKLNIDSTTGVDSDLDDLNGRVINPSTSTTLADLGLSEATDSFQITYNGTAKIISVKNTDKLSDIINNISTATSGAVTASFSQLTGKFIIQSASTGSSQTIAIGIGSGTGKALTALGLADTNNNPNAIITLGKDAKLSIKPPGATTATDIIKSTNNFTIDGMSYNLAGEGASTITVGSDTSKVYDKIKDFIDKYNEIVDKIQTKLLEKKSSDYKPLTDSQKESMTDDQIAAWETKAKTGLLRNDQNLQNMLSGLKSAFTSGVSGVGFTIGRYGSSSIGIDTSKDYSKPAHIEITDASKLKAAISTNGEQILKLFANASSSTDKTTAYKENGIFTRIKSILQENVGFTNTTLNTAILTKYANKQEDFSSTGTAGSSTLPDQIYQKQLLVDKLKTALADKQEYYYQKFSKLETAMNTLNSQSSWLTQQFSS